MRHNTFNSCRDVLWQTKNEKNSVNRVTIWF